MLAKLQIGWCTPISRTGDARLQPMRPTPRRLSYRSKATIWLANSVLHGPARSTAWQVTRAIAIFVDGRAAIRFAHATLNCVAIGASELVQATPMARPSPPATVAAANIFNALHWVFHDHARWSDRCARARRKAGQTCNTNKGCR